MYPFFLSEREGEKTDVGTFESGKNDIDRYREFLHDFSYSIPSLFRVMESGSRSPRFHGLEFFLPLISVWHRGMIYLF